MTDLFLIRVFKGPVQWVLRRVRVWVRVGVRVRVRCLEEEEGV